MSIVQQLVQISVVEAWRGATLAGNDVFDSKMDTLPNLTKGQSRPVLIFSVEESEEEAGGPAEAGFLGRSARLAGFVQALVTTGQAIKDDGGTVIRPAIGETDAAYEATLNILNRQWRQVLHGHQNPWAAVFRGLVVGIGSVKSIRATDPETGGKHAARFTQFHLDVVADPLPGDKRAPAIDDGLALLEADGDAGYALIASEWRALLEAGGDWPEWRKLQSGLFASDSKITALGYGRPWEDPEEGDDP